MKTQQRLTQKVQIQDQARLHRVTQLCNAVLDELFCTEVVGGQEERNNFELMTQAGQEGDYNALICN